MTERQSEAMRLRWADPAARAKLLPVARKSVKKALAASVVSPNKNRSGKPPHSEASRTAARAGMLAAWADPVRAARMRAAQLKGARKAQELRGGPIPKDPEYRKLRNLLGAKAAREAFKSLPAGCVSPGDASRAAAPLVPTNGAAAALSSQEASHAADD